MRAISSFNSRTPGGVRRSRGAFPTHSGRRFNSRTPGGVRLGKGDGKNTTRSVSIHAPREGCDPFPLIIFFSLYTFQFTHPGRGATTKYDKRKTLSRVSIHAPREGCDDAETIFELGNFVSIHAPREGCDGFEVS